LAPWTPVNERIDATVAVGIGRIADSRRAAGIGIYLGPPLRGYDLDIPLRNEAQSAP
jgi:hypothetical protein